MLIGLGAFDPNCIKKDNCKPQCVEFFRQKYNLQIPGWNYSGAVGDEGCYKSDNCKPQCIENLRAFSAEQQTVTVQQNMPGTVQAQQAVSTNNYLLIGGAVLAAGALLYFALR
jgi:hypothetical protein